MGGEEPVEMKNGAKRITNWENWILDRANWKALGKNMYTSYPIHNVNYIEF